MHIYIYMCIYVYIYIYIYISLSFSLASLKSPGSLILIQVWTGIALIKLCKIEKDTISELIMCVIIEKYMLDYNVARPQQPQRPDPYIHLSRTDIVDGSSSTSVSEDNIQKTNIKYVWYRHITSKHIWHKHTKHIRTTHCTTTYQTDITAYVLKIIPNTSRMNSQSSHPTKYVPTNPR